MDDDTLAPFVDALASALIMMVLVSIFFLLQTATSITESAKLSTISEKEIKNEQPQFSPIIYRDVVEYSLDENLFKYVVNYKLDKMHRQLIARQLEGVKALNITVSSNDDRKKSVVNMLTFIQAMNFPVGMEVHTKVIPSKSVLSSLSWEIIK